MGELIQFQQYEQITDEEAFAVWELQMKVASCSKRTIEERRWQIKKLAEFIDAPVITATRLQLMQWLAREHLSPKTRVNYKSLLHTFYTILQDEGYRQDNPAARLPRGKSPRIEADPFTTGEVQKLLDSGIYGRARMMVLLAAYQGFRATEIASTSGAHIDWEHERILTVDAKGGVEVWRPLHPAVLAEARLHPDRFRQDDWWFGGIGPNKGTHINAKSVSNTLSHAVKRAGIKHRPHQLRAWFATELMESGADMLTIQHAMRHATAGTLKHYVRPSMGQMDDAMRRLPALAVPTSSGRRS